MSRLTLALFAVLAACGGAAPQSIQAPPSLVLRDTSLSTIDAAALDAEGNVLDGVSVSVTATSDPSVLQVGNNGELQCRKWGLATVTLEAAPARRDVAVSCRLVKELRVAPARLTTTLERDDTGKVIAKDLGGYMFQAIGLDDKAIKDAPIEVTASDEGVLEQTEDGQLRALRPGKATITGVLDVHTATLEVEVGELVTTRKAITVEDSDGIGIPVPAGRYRVAVGASEPVRVVAKGGACDDHEDGKELSPVCTFSSAGNVRIENPGTLGLGADATVTMRIIAVP